MGEFDYAEKKKKIEEDRDFIDSPAYNNSLKELLEKTTKNEISDSTIKKILLINQNELESILESARIKLRAEMTKERLRDFLTKDDHE